MNARHVYPLAYLAALAAMENKQAGGFPTEKAYRAARKRQRIARASRRANR